LEVDGFLLRLSEVTVRQKELKVVEKDLALADVG